MDAHNSTTLSTLTTKATIQTTSVTPVFETTTTRVGTTTTVIWTPSSSQASSNIPEKRLPVVEQVTHERFASISSSVILAFYIMAFISCCIPCTTRSDTKFMKLFDPSVSGLTRGCRIRLTTVQTTASFTEGLVEMAVMLLSLDRNASSSLFLHCAIITVTRTLVVMWYVLAIFLSSHSQ
ncbi:hypothetical protein COOONC_14231 [Cooperia oncophora]